MSFCPNCNFLLDLTNKVPDNLKTKVKTTQGIYLMCNNCNYIDNLKPNSIIYKDSKNKNAKEDLSILQLRTLDKTLPRTKDYICPNVKCSSKNNSVNKEAVFYRPNNNSYRLKYLCTICETSWVV